MWVILHLKSSVYVKQPKDVIDDLHAVAKLHQWSQQSSLQLPVIGLILL